jgi:poly(A) polymerase
LHEEAMTKRRTGRQAINRIIHDKRLDPRAFVVGYTDRLAEHGVQQKPLTEWKEGEIPAHRISYLLCRGVVVWRRGEPEDQLDDEHLPRSAWLEPEKPAE